MGRTGVSSIACAQQLSEASCGGPAAAARLIDQFVVKTPAALRRIALRKSIEWNSRLDIGVKGGRGPLLSC